MKIVVAVDDGWMSASFSGSHSVWTLQGREGSMHTGCLIKDAGGVRVSGGEEVLDFLRFLLPTVLFHVHVWSFPEVYSVLLTKKTRMVIEVICIGI